MTPLRHDRRISTQPAQVHPRFGPPNTEEAASLIRAALRVIETSGTAEPAVQDILREASLSTPALYRNFASKSELLLRVHFEAVGILTRRLRKSMAKHESPAAKVRAYVEGMLLQATRRAVIGSRTYLLASTQQLLDFPTERDQLERQLSSPLGDVIREACDSGVFTSPDADADARCILDFTTSCLRRHLMELTSPSQAEIDALADFALRALRPPAA